MGNVTETDQTISILIHAGWQIEEFLKPGTGSSGAENQDPCGSVITNPG